MEYNDTQTTEKKYRDLDFSKLKISGKTLEDAIYNINSFKKLNKNYGDKAFVMRALVNHDYNTLREISCLFYETSGIYQRMCKYLAYLYRYDWMVVPFITKIDSVNEDKVLKDFAEVLNYLDNSRIAYSCGDIALKMIKEGCFYGYLSDSTEGAFFQELPIQYCRSRFYLNGVPAVEFNMRYFDDKFPDVQYRMRILDSFPKEFSKGYVLYKQGKLKPDFQGDDNGWYLLDSANCFKFNLCGSDFPILVNAIPSIIDLDEAQGLDRRKMLQKLLKIIIQKLPLDKNNELIFDPEEARDIHNTAVNMLRDAVGVDVLTTFADVDVADMADKNTATSTDDLQRVERTVFNAFGTSRNLFNSDSNLALEKSILDDEASIRCLPLQFETIFNRIVQRFNKNKKYSFKFRMLETTIYNYKDLSKMYKEQTQIGYSKMLPQIALGHSQSEILATIQFENEVLHLSDIMLPPLSSNVMNADALLARDKNNSNNKDNNNQSEEESKGGRPEKEDGEKSDKTIANLESQ